MSHKIVKNYIQVQMDGVRENCQLHFILQTKIIRILYNFFNEFKIIQIQGGGAVKVIIFNSKYISKTRRALKIS